MQHVLSKTRMLRKKHMLYNGHVFIIVKNSRCLFEKASEIQETNSFLTRWGSMAVVWLRAGNDGGV